MDVHVEEIPKTIEIVRDGQEIRCHYIDERLLPGKLQICKTNDWKELVSAVKELAVRGAPALGIAGAAALTLWVSNADSPSNIDAVAEEIATARPTAVNLRWAVRRALDEVIAQNATCNDMDTIAELLFAFTRDLQAEDERVNRTMGENGASLLPRNARVLTHCNAGSLATHFFGTALGVVYTAALQGRVSRVYADETRPVGQGARLTTWELARAGIPVTLICDNMAASIMAKGMIDAVIVGADRIAANGDTANKIGTYGVAVLARAHGIPFYVAAPTSTVDCTLESGDAIVIEERSPDEVLAEPIAGVDVLNPAFDVTPARLITKIITETGVYDPVGIRASKPE